MSTRRGNIKMKSILTGTSGVDVINTSRLHQYETPIAMSLIAGAALFLFTFGIVGLFRAGHFGFDFPVFHQAGEQFLAGLNPWLLSIGSDGPFAYPPHMGSLIAVYGAFSFEFALTLHTFIVLGSIVSLVILANRWFLHMDNWRTMSITQGFCIALIIGNPFMAHDIYSGQMSIPATACALWSWHWLQKDRWILAGILLGIATLKPQVSVFLVLWLMLSLNWQVLLVASGVALVLLVPGFVNYGVIPAFESWFKAMEYYQTAPANRPGFQHVVGFESIFATLGIHGTGMFFKPIGLLCLVALYIKRAAFSVPFTVSLFFVIALTFVYGHDSDFVTLAVLWSYFVFLAFSSKSRNTIVVALALLAIFYFPQRFLRLLDWPMIYQWRTIVILACCWLIYRWERQTRTVLM